MLKLSAVKKQLVSLAFSQRSKDYALALLQDFGSQDPQADLDAVLQSDDAVVSDHWAVQPTY
jgi:hypothetical protein